MVATGTVHGQAMLEMVEALALAVCVSHRALRQGSAVEYPEAPLDFPFARQETLCRMRRPVGTLPCTVRTMLAWCMEKLIEMSLARAAPHGLLLAASSWSIPALVLQSAALLLTSDDGLHDSDPACWLPLVTWLKKDCVASCLLQLVEIGCMVRLMEWLVC